MSRLIRPGAVLDDGWIDLDDASTLPASGSAIVSWERWKNELTGQSPAGLALGVRLPNTADVTALWPELSHLPLIVLTFPSFADGRAYSQAQLLRHRYGYAGELRATGAAVVRDQLQQMHRCGFDTFILREDQNPELCAQSFGDLSLSYQPSSLTRIDELRRQ